MVKGETYTATVCSVSNPCIKVDTLVSSLSVNTKVRKGALGGSVGWWTRRWEC